MKKLLLTTLIGTVTICNAMGVEGSVGTLGTGISITLPIQQSDFSIKLNANTMDLKGNDFNANANSYGLLLGYNVWRGLSLNGGVYYVKGSISHNQALLAPELQQAQVANSTTSTFDGFSPYIGASYKADIYKGWYINTDAGVMQVQSQNTHSTITEMVNSGQLAQSNYSSTTGSTNYYPVVKVSIGFDF